MTRLQILEKITKLLALGSSPEPHEADLALKKAKELMDAYSLTMTDVEAAQIHERRIQMGRFRKPPAYLAGLANLIKHITGAECIGEPYYDHKGHYMELCWIGVEPGVTIADYAYSRLARQLIKDRKTHLSGLNKRRKRANRIKAADIYAEGWVSSLAEKVFRLMPQVDVPQAVTKYADERDIEKHTGRSPKRSKKDAEHFIKGWVDGHAVDLHHGVNQTDLQKKLK